MRIAKRPLLLGLSSLAILSLVVAADAGEQIHQSLHGFLLRRVIAARVRLGLPPTHVRGAWCDAPPCRNACATACAHRSRDRLTDTSRGELRALSATDRRAAARNASARRAPVL